MKAIGVLPGRREVKLVDHPETQLTAPDEVKLRILDVGVCGTDKEICAFQYGTPPPGFDYLALGHESLDCDLVVFNAVDCFSVGDLVVAMVRCGSPHSSCASCRHDRQYFRFSGDFTQRGITKAHGFMTEFIVVRAKYFHR